MLFTSSNSRDRLALAIPFIGQCTSELVPQQLSYIRREFAPHYYVFRLPPEPNRAPGAGARFRWTKIATNPSPWAPRKLEHAATP